MLDTNAAKTVSEAVHSRITARAFLDKAVEPALLKTILQKALQAPSGGNLQPWRAHVMTGQALTSFCDEVYQSTLDLKQEKETHQPYPKPLWEPQRSWRYKLGEDMYALLGIERDNKPGRLMWLANNSRFFEAPVGVIITGNKALNMPQHLDVGIFLQTLMLLAREAGLHTAPQGWWRSWPETCARHLDIPEDEEVLVGLGMGYADPEANVNNLRADRAQLDELVHFYAD